MPLTRLHALLGAPLAALSAEHVQGLVANAVREDVDLDFKAPLYGHSDSDKRELAGDIGALANTVGGALVLGIADRDGAAVDAPGVELSDAEERRITQTMASWLVPLCHIQIHRIQSSANHGFYVIEVPRSINAPHAVRVGEGLRYPRRIGTSTRWLAETEVADAYRNRFSQAQAQVATLGSVYADGVAGISRYGWDGETAWLAVAILPDHPGEFELLQSTPRELADRLRARSHPFEGLQSRIALFDPRPTTGLRRVIVSQGVNETNQPSAGYWQFHTDGASFGATGLGSPDRTEDGRQLVDPFQFVINDEVLVIETAGIVEALVDHAIETCHTSGTAILCAGIVALTDEGSRPVALFHRRGRFGFGRIGPGTPDLPTSDHSVDLDAISSSPRELLVATRTIVTDFSQALGRPECWQIDREGRLRRPYWSQQRQAVVVPWAKRVGIEVTEELLPGEG